MGGASGQTHLTYAGGLRAAVRIVKGLVTNMDDRERS